MSDILPTSDIPSGRRGVVAVVTRADRFLVIRRSAQVVAPGAYCFPGGGIEADESEEQALAREFLEELNSTIKPVRLLWRSFTPWETQLAWWLAELDPSAKLVPHPAEVESFYWLTHDEMLEHADLLASNRQFLAALASGEVAL